MGIYCYTLRKQTITVDGLQIGHAKYAFKDGWDARYNARAKRLYAAAERARDANPNLEHIIMGDYSHARTEPLAVYKIDKSLDSFFDSRSPGPIAGYLSKEGRKFVFTPNKEMVDA